MDEDLNQLSNLKKTLTFFVLCDLFTKIFIIFIASITFVGILYFQLLYILHSNC